MQQTIKFLRGQSTYNSYNAAITALNGLTHKVGQPVVALYNYTPEGSETQKTAAILAIGKAQATGVDAYEILANYADVSELTSLLGTHATTYANGGTYGHVKESTDIAFSNGEGTINNEAVTLAKIQKITKNRVLGYVGDNSANATGAVVQLTDSDLRTLINVADGAEVNQNAFSYVQVGNEANPIEAESKTDTLTIDSSDGVSVTGDATNDKVTVGISNNGIALGKLAQAVNGKFLGTEKSSNVGEQKNIVALTPAQALENLGIAGTINKVKVGSTTITETGLNGTIEFAAGDNITLTPDTTNNNKKVTVAFDGANAALTGTPTAPTAALNTNTTQIATTAFVVNEINDKIAAAEAMIYKGTIGTVADGGTVQELPYSTAKTGWTYKVVTAGSYTISQGVSANCEVGDMIICLTGATQSTGATWTVVQNNIDGAVTGPDSSTTGHIATFNGATGKVIQDSGKSLSDLVPSTRTITAGDCLHIGTSDNSSDLSQDITINHDALSSAASLGSGAVLTGLTIDSYGHVSAGTSVDPGISNSGTTANTQYVSGIAWDSTTKTQLNVTYTDLPAESGKVKVASGKTSGYLGERLLEMPAGTITSITNGYSVKTDIQGNVMYLYTVIDTIDGGTF